MGDSRACTHCDSGATRSRAPALEEVSRRPAVARAARRVRWNWACPLGGHAARAL